MLLADKLSYVPVGDTEWTEVRIELIQIIQGWQRQIETATRELLELPSPALRERLRTLEAEKEGAETRLREIESRVVAAGPGLQRAALELRSALNSAQPNRPIINSLLRQMFDHVVVDGDEHVLRFAWKHGIEQTHPLYDPPAPIHVGPTPIADAVWRMVKLRGK